TGSYVGKGRGGKLLRVDLYWQDGRAERVSIRGDFFAHPEDGFDAAEDGLAGVPLTELGQVFGRQLEARGVTLFGLLPSDLDDAVESIVSSAIKQG
ncbi:MAG TPA: hypothetical protein PK625_06625, partial [Spirochaetales bacterium]|nr:hypothetical protein [Spirochaetales bacterium]